VAKKISAGSVAGLVVGRVELGAGLTSDTVDAGDRLTGGGSVWLGGG